jgi:hypothetical protein
LYTEALSLFHELGDTVELARVLEELAPCAVDLRCWHRALRLAAGASTLREKLGSRLPPSRTANLENHLLVARHHVEQTAAAMAWMEGTELSLEQLVVYARGDG